MNQSAIRAGRSSIKDRYKDRCGMCIEERSDAAAISQVEAIRTAAGGIRARYRNLWIASNLFEIPFARVRLEPSPRRPSAAERGCCKFARVFAAMVHAKSSVGSPIGTQNNCKYRSTIKQTRALSPHLLRSKKTISVKHTSCFDCNF